jgi:hypothetical protein
MSLPSDASGFNLSRRIMRELIGVALSSVLFYLSNRMGSIIRLTGRGWKQPYRTYYKLVDASRRARTWGQRAPRSITRGEQLGRGATVDNRTGFGPFDSKTIIPMLGPSANLAISGREADLFSGSGSSGRNENAVCQERLTAVTIVKPFGQHSGQT